MDITLQKILDYEAIKHCLYTYCRGVDQADRDCLLQAYWPEAIDHHGAYQGTAIGFIDTAMQTLHQAIVSIHQINNILIDYDPHQAKVESKFYALQIYPSQNTDQLETQIWGRYADIFEQRAGVWKIIKRTVIYDWVQEKSVPSITLEQRFGQRQPIGSFYPHDPSYILLK